MSQGRFNIAPAYRPLVAQVRAQGAHVQFRGKHYAIVKPGVRMIFIPVTPSDHRAAYNCISELRRAGFVINGRART